MARKLTIRRLVLIVISMAMTGAIHTGAQAAQQADCNSWLTRLAIMSDGGDLDVGISPIYTHCVSSALAITPTFTPQKAIAPGGVASRPAMEKQERAWPRQDYVTD